MSFIKIITEDAVIGGRDEAGPWSERVEISPEQFVLAFEGSQIAQKILEGVKLDIEAKYVVDPVHTRFAHLQFTVTATAWLSQPYIGTCRSPRSSEEIGRSIADTVIAALQTECKSRETQNTRLTTMLSTLTVTV